LLFRFGKLAKSRAVLRKRCQSPAKQSKKTRGPALAGLFLFGQTFAKTRRIGHDCAWADARPYHIFALD
jgi:hypothetical protein